MIPVFKPLLEAEEQSAMHDALEVGWLGMGALVGRFEAALTSLLELEGERVVAVSTGHAALHLSMLLLGVGPGDDVVSASFNNVADFQAIAAVGATPRFCDIDDHTLCIDPEQAAALVGPRTRAIIAMDYAQHQCDHQRLRAIADECGVALIHDAAHSIGSRYAGQPMGHQGDLTAFSFDAIKTFTAIDGGAIVARDAAQVARLRALRLIGMQQPTSTMYSNRRASTSDVTEVGYRYHLANPHAAIGLAQLDKFDRIAGTRRAAISRYESAFGDLDWLRTPGAVARDAVPFMYYVRVAADQRDDFREHLAGRGVESGFHWKPGHWYSLFEDAPRGPLGVTDRVAREIVTLPLHSDMAPSALDAVIDAVASFLPTG